MISVTRRYPLPAAHVLASKKLSDDENRRIFGKCANPNGHGHNYELEITVRGPVQEATGQIVPVATLDALFEEVVASRYSHQMLNELEPFDEIVPTAENIARVVHEDLAPLVRQRTDAELARVRVIETSRNFFEYGDPR